MKVCLEDMKNKIKAYLPIFAVYVIFSVIIYSQLMVHNLVNQYDGLWEYSFYKSGKWELSIGRWLWLYLDRVRFGLSADPVTSIITIVCFSIAVILILDIFDIRGKISYLVGFLFLSSTAVCISLSYRYMSPTFGMSFLLSIFAAWFLVKIKRYVLGAILGGLGVALSMGLYQANLGSTCLLLLTFLMYMLYQREVTLKEFGKRILQFFCSLAFGGIGYAAGLKLNLLILDATVSDYKGADSYSLLHSIKSLPGSVSNIWYVFRTYFENEMNKINYFHFKGMFLLLFGIVIVFLLFAAYQIFQTSKVKALLFLVLGVLFPFACNAVLLIATQCDTSLQMTAPMALLFPTFLCLIFKFAYKKKWLGWVRRGSAIIFVLLLYGNIAQVQMDQNAMYEGSIATTTMAQEILHDLNDEGYLGADNQYCFIGLPAANPMFSVEDSFQKANMYAKFGAWWTDPACTRRSWESVFQRLCGTNINVCSPDMYKVVQADEEVQRMPTYPTEGYIMEKDGVVIVKISE